MNADHVTARASSRKGMRRVRYASEAEAIERNTDRSVGPDACWLWTGPLDQKGYGQVRFRDRRYRAHRLAYEVAHGPVPDGLGVLHSCDTPRCCNPAHLRAGTQADNGADASERGRVARGARISRSKLTEETVREIRRRPASTRAMAKKFGVSRRTIQHVLTGEVWGWLS